MIKISFQRILPGFMAIICCCMLAACSNLPPSLAQSEEELIAYMHEYIIRQEIHPNFAYIPPTDQPRYVARAQTSLIVLAPPKEGLEDLHQPLNLGQPIQAWWYTNHRLLAAGDPAAAMDLYQDNYMTSPGIDAWGFYTLGIFSISADGQEAEVYLGVSCGPKCGHGNLFMFERNRYWQWNLTGSEWMWIE